MRVPPPAEHQLEGAGRLLLVPVERRQDVRSRPRVEVELGGQRVTVLGLPQQRVDLQQ